MALKRNDLVPADLDGVEDKYYAIYDNHRWIVKKQRKDWNNCLSEYVGSHVINILGGNVQDTRLADVDGELCVMCKDFTEYIVGNKSLKDVRESSLDIDKSKHEYYFEDILYTMSKLSKADTSCLRSEFIQMYVYDVILGNTDRHIKNWEYYILDGFYHLTPIFDNGASLLPRAKIQPYPEEWWRDRVYNWPNSKVMFNDVKERSNYYDIYNSSAIPDSAKVWAYTFDMNKVESWINSVEELSDIDKKFYATYIRLRYDCIICNIPWEEEVNNYASTVIIK